MNDVQRLWLAQHFSGEKVEKILDLLPDDFWKNETKRQSKLEVMEMALTRIAYLRDLNPHLQASDTACDAESEFRNYYCKMGDIAKKALGQLK